MASPETIRRIASALDIVDIIDSVVPLQKKGKNYFACCPFHEESTPSFSVNATDQLYYCHGACGDGGDVFKFWSQYHNKSFPETLRDLADKAGIPLEEDRPQTDASRREQQRRNDILVLLESAQAFFAENLESPSESKDYWAARGVSQEMQQLFGLGVAKDGWKNLIDKFGGFENASLLSAAGLVVLQAKTATEKGRFYDRFRNAPMFPIRDERGRVLSFAQRRIGDSKPGENSAKYINGPETDVFKKNEVAYGLHEALQANPHPHNIVVTEGYMDVIMSHQHGFTNTVASMGTAASEAVVKKLFRYTNEVVFCFDGDKAGVRAAERALHASLPLLSDEKHVKFLFLPPDYDPDSFLREFGADAYQLFLDSKSIPASKYIHKIAQDGLGNLATMEARAQYFGKAKGMLDLMPPSVLKAMLLSQVEQTTGLRPSEYLPYSIQLSLGHLGGVDIASVEQEVREFVALKVGAPVSDVRVNWSMPELTPHRQVSVLPESNADIQKVVGHRMHEVSRILAFESRVTDGISLSQLLNTANHSTDYSKDLAKALLSRYLADTNSFDVECQILLHHMSVIREGLAAMSSASLLDVPTREKVNAWLENVIKRTAAVKALEAHMDSAMAYRVQSHIDSFIGSAEQAQKDVSMQQQSADAHDKYQHAQVENVIGASR